MDVLLCIAGVNQPPPAGLTESDRWTHVIAMNMEPDSQIEFLTDVADKTHPLTPLGAFVLANRMCEHALGLDMFAASNLATQVLAGWFLFSAWAYSRGLNPLTMPPEALLAARYQQMQEPIQDPKDREKMHRQIFGTAYPWGR